MRISILARSLQLHLRLCSRTTTWLRTTGVNTNGAAAKVCFVCYRLGKKVHHLSLSEPPSRGAVTGGIYRGATIHPRPKIAPSLISPRYRLYEDSQSLTVLLTMNASQHCTNDDNDDDDDTNNDNNNTSNNNDNNSDNDTMPTCSTTQPQMKR